MPPLPQPEVLSRNGSYLAYLRMEEHVGVFREFLRQQADTPDQQELIAAKLMGRWRSGAPLVLRPDQDDPALGGDLQRTNDFDYKDADPHGYGCPIGAHIRRMNPRDTAENMQRRKMIRRGGTYGPPLPEGAPDDGVERGIAAFIGCVSLIRQFEFAMNVWVNDPKFKGLDNERDPIIGTSGRHVRHDDSQAAHSEEDSWVCPRSPPFGVARTSSFPASGRCGFSPSGQAMEHAVMRSTCESAHLQPGPRAAPVHAREAAVQHLLDLELPVGSEPRRHGDGQPLLHDHRGAPSGLATYETPEYSARCSCRASPARSSCSICRCSGFSSWSAS